MNKGYTFEEVINNNVDFGAKWAELGWFEEDSFENGHYYYFSNWYGSEGGYYNEETDELKPSYEIDEMEPEEAEKIWNSWDFVEYPIDREVSGLHVDYDRHYNSEYFNEKYSEEVIKDEEELNYYDGSGIYQYIDGLFYEVKLITK